MISANPCDNCMNQSNCKNQDKVTGITICEMFKPNILSSVSQNLNCNYPNYTFVCGVDITTGFLHIAVFGKHRTSTGETEDDANPIKILTIETNPFVDKFGFEDEIRYKMRGFKDMNQYLNEYISNWDDVEGE